MNEVLLCLLEIERWIYLEFTCNVYKEKIMSENGMRHEDKLWGVGKWVIGRELGR